jgi:hypothetical protein
MRHDVTNPSRILKPRWPGHSLRRPGTGGSSHLADGFVKEVKFFRVTVLATCEVSL